MKADFSLQDLEKIIAARASDSAQKSYTKTLLEKGTPIITKKLGEEAVETIIAALQQDKQDLINETADLLYHIMVLLQAKNISLEDVLSELERRTGQSGHEEKASR